MCVCVCVCVCSHGDQARYFVQYLAPDSFSDFTMIRKLESEFKKLIEHAKSRVGMTKQSLQPPKPLQAVEPGKDVMSIILSSSQPSQLDSSSLSSSLHSNPSTSKPTEVKASASLGLSPLDTSNSMTAVITDPVTFTTTPVSQSSLLGTPSKNMLDQMVLFRRTATTPTRRHLWAGSSSTPRSRNSFVRMHSFHNSDIERTQRWKKHREELREFLEQRRKELVDHDVKVQVYWPTQFSIEADPEENAATDDDGDDDDYEDDDDDDDDGDYFGGTEQTREEQRTRLQAQIATKRKYCEDLLGEALFLRVYNIVKNVGQNSEDEQVDTQLHELFSKPGQKQCIREINQMLHCENILEKLGN